MAIMQGRPDTPMGSADAEPCRVCDATPVVLVALRHPVMRLWTEALLGTEHGCWEVTQVAEDELLVDAITRTNPDLVVVDERDFPDCRQAALDRLPPGRVVVVGPEPDLAYRSSAMDNGAGGWVCRDRVGEELSSAMRSALGCNHQPCPPIREAAMQTPHAGGPRR